MVNSPAPCDQVGVSGADQLSESLFSNYVYVEFAMFEGGERCWCGVLRIRSGRMAVIDAWCNLGRASLILSQACGASGFVGMAMVSAAAVRRTSTLHNQAFKGSVTESAKRI